MKVAGLVVLVMAISSCSDSIDCDGWCDLTLQCVPAVYYSPGCSWADENAARGDCMSRCAKASKQLNEPTRDANRKAVDCWASELQGPCDADALSAVASKCDDPASDFLEAFADLAVASPLIECAE